MVYIAKKVAAGDSKVLHVATAEEKKIEKPKKEKKQGSGNNSAAKNDTQQ
jgi:hypothetical protein